eukprot:563980-Amphidinium_carterae.1
MALERALFDERSNVSKVYVGFLLMMLYAHIRFSDLLSAEALNFDKDKDGNIAFLEAKTKNFKTANVVGMSGEYLHFVAPAVGVSGRNWGEEWTNAPESATCGWPTGPP